MAHHLLSFWAVNGNDLDELHIGHVALLMKLRSLLRRRDTDLKIIFNQREAYGMRGGLSSRHVRAYKRFFERLFVTFHVPNASSRITVVQAPDFIQEIDCKAVLQSVNFVFSKLEQVVDSLAEVTSPSDEQILSSLCDSLGTDATGLSSFVSAMRPFLVDRDVKSVRIFEEMAPHNTAIIAAVADKWKEDVRVVSGKRHSYKYDLSKAIIKHLGLHFPKHIFVPNISDVYGQKHMQARGGAPPILITAEQRQIEAALFDSQKYKGPKLLSQILDNILQNDKGIRIGRRDIKRSKDLKEKDIGKTEFVQATSEALYRIMEPFRETRDKAYEETRGKDIEFSARTCLETLAREFDPPGRSFPEEANDSPLKYRDDFLMLQDHALRHAQDLLGATLVGQSISRACSLAKLSGDIDVLSYFTSKRYRDHHIHVLNVLYAGWILLGLRLTDGSSLEAHVARILNWNGEESLVRTAWILTSLLHDHCYPVAFALAHSERMRALYHHYGTAAEKIIEAVEESMATMLGRRMRVMVNRALGGTKGEFPANELWTFLYSLFGEELEVCQTPNFSREVAFDHGVLGALNLLDYSSVTKRPKNDNLTHDRVLFEVARSILLHNLTHCTQHDDKIGEIPIKFQDNPLGTLLVLCDEMQEWGRTCLGPKGYETMIGRMAFGPIDNDRLDKDILRCTFQYTHDAQKEFYQWNFDLFAQGKAKNLRRLSFTGIPFPAKFEFSVGIHGMSINLMD